MLITSAASNVTRGSTSQPGNLRRLASQPGDVATCRHQFLQHPPVRFDVVHHDSVPRRVGDG